MLERSVLVLNQNYEPLSVCSVRRALLLILRGKAETVEKLAEVVRSVTQDHPVPSVVRLGRYIRAPRRRVVLSKRNILKRDNHQCQYCGRKDSKLTIDHIVPRTRGGKSTWENLVCACAACNNKKGEHQPEQVGLILRAKPKRPNNVSFIRNLIGANDQRWKPYLFID
ncbi:MAG: HNH endonuclease [Candidatus Latescibacterota bacterium]|nr:HNH endonuclease [Candidatus Latescibacterota bacterium]